MDKEKEIKVKCKHCGAIKFVPADTDIKGLRCEVCMLMLQFDAKT
jgi:RNase P subunit RPR2